MSGPAGQRADYSRPFCVASIANFSIFQRGSAGATRLSLCALSQQSFAKSGTLAECAKLHPLGAFACAKLFPSGDPSLCTAPKAATYHRGAWLTSNANRSKPDCKVKPNPAHHRPLRPPSRTNRMALAHPPGDKRDSGSAIDERPSRARIR